MSTPTEHQLAVWNAVLNPPEARSKLADLVFDEDALDLRNEYVYQISALRVRDPGSAQLKMSALREHDKEWDFDRLMLGSSEAFNMVELLDRRDQLAQGKLAEYYERGKKNLDPLKDEIVDRIMVSAPAGLQRSAVWTYVDTNLFANYKLDRHGRAVVQPDFEVPLFDGVDGGVSSQVVRQYNTLLADSAEYMDSSDRLWKLLEDGVDRGRLDPSVLYLMNTVAQGKDLSQEAYLDIMSRYQVVPSGGLGIAQTVQAMVGEYMEDWGDREQSVFDGFLNHGPESYSLFLYSRSGVETGEGKEDLPVVGADRRRDAPTFAYFREFHWEFDKDIGYNLEKILKDSTFEGMGFHPGVDVLPSEWMALYDEDEMRSVLRTSMKILKDAVGGSDAADAYRLELESGEAGVEAGLDVFKEFLQHFGVNGSKYSDTVVTGFQRQEDATWSETVRESNLRTAAAKEFLYQVLEPGETASDELVKMVEDKLKDFTNLRDMVDGTTSDSRAVRSWAIQQHQSRVDKELFVDAGIDMDDVIARRGALDDFLQGYLGSEAYSEFRNGEKDVDYHKLVDYFGGFEGIPEARNDRWFLDQVDELVAGYTRVSLAAREEDEATKARQDEIAAEKRIADDTTLFSNRLSRMFREFGPDGKAVVGAFSDPAFVNHIDNVIIPRIVQKAYYEGLNYQTEENVRSIFNQATSREDIFYGLMPFDFDEDFYSMQFDEDRPPGFPGGRGPRFVEPGEFAPRFDVSAFADHIDSAAIESPEFANFLSQELGGQSFEEAWQEAATPRARRDRGAELDAADARVASFQSAVDAFLGGDPHLYNDFEVARARAAAVRGDPDATPHDIAVAERAVELAQGRYSRREAARVQAEKNLEDAKARAAREKGEVTAEYALDPVTQQTVPTGQQVPVTSLFDKGVGGMGSWSMDPYGYARERREAYIEPGLTQREFFERELPGLTERYEGTYLQSLEQQRLENQRLAAEVKRLEDERTVESRRRSRLSGSRAMNVFGRRA